MGRFEELLKESIPRNVPDRKAQIAGIDSILNKMKNRLLITKINVQLDEIDDWVFETVPELVLSYPEQSDMKHFDHFENESGLVNIISKYISTVYYGIVNKKYPSYFKRFKVDGEL